MKLFLYSLAISAEQATYLTKLVGKDPEDISFALIENAADVVPNSRDWLGGFRDMLQYNGYRLERVDLRNWRGKQKALHQKLASKDVIWVGGGHTYYLRWILKDTGADNSIRELVSNGKVYAGWSAGALVAGPTLRYFETMDNPDGLPEVITDGLHLTHVVPVPHLDNRDFAEDTKLANQQLEQAGYNTVLLGDTQALMIDGDAHTIL
ncbi:Type 1 glutamine amidotransferase-like domain-containing protein [Fulvivirgaceae bacterium PWU4]|uniref:Type 1 glutamine amidotransferase-like domain-containing protein n=1 Tax=Chryseosolibacter histidini TaxID=2782349 RepID=A0AAP2DHQ5_9BACT|nr:Type 1 glutamine amidotransferase-like domain-containing protein [Chryseosolibacter histidini]MBT1696618.1 Type 1 glutamine amidotransferase-like domain-containing protein [Chryseosolibacter histidini]